MSKVATFLALVLFLNACGQKQSTPESPYALALKQHRKTVHESFLNENESPLNAEERKQFLGLNYFAADSTFAVNAQVQWHAIPDTIVLGTSTGEDRKLLKAATLTFDIGGTTLQLSAYFGRVSNTKIWNTTSFFIPFTDETSAFESYGAGRYLDIDVSGKPDVVVLDFNYAYNPYCAYNNRYSCPIPPAENHLNIAVKAGEKNYKTY